MQNPLGNFIAIFSLFRDVRGFQVNPLCRHDITSPFPPSGNGGYIRNVDVVPVMIYSHPVEIVDHFKYRGEFCG